jgi:ribosomal protein S18 acetylase RimI-like enzyme
MSYLIRSIEPRDDEAVASIVRRVAVELGATGCGSSSEDPEIECMSEAYSGPKAAFFVVEMDGRVAGCGGFGPLAGGPEGTCELRKMYFLPQLRGKGAGRDLLEACIDAARSAGYAYCYLETRDSMKIAQILYAHHGFELLPERMGDTGHFACGTFMGRKL